MREELEASFDVFVVAALPRLRKLAYVWCRDWHRGDDAVQETLKRMYVAWPRIRRDGDAFAFARTTLLRRLISDERRPWRVREVAGLTPGEHDPPASPGDPGVRLDLDEALAALPPRQRAVILLRYVEGLSVAEVADALSCSEGTVKSQAHDAKAKLKARLGPDYGPTPPTPISLGPTSSTTTRPMRVAPHRGEPR
ncbi:RNA polymerase sigma factor (sigma-70 family) [Kineococcus xinjiangensis]|uniref:RNA polymerase sigma factor (Sigma-70 family) n=1 Tax=Kineococcus xinjiangensis TaxID=512762 RepID=A0A2S6IER8_9ACTN|nr:SigE family RNA polymerase sigma factor [Kineococcus xinjiangensis]PPK92699.1 RNA polymerase sigma factor (sigma-70 family) [Kineococcus xinjiangensis]